MERELGVLGQLSEHSSAPVTTLSLGLGAMRERAPGLCSELVQRYTELLELSLEERAYRADHDISGGLRSLAESLGFLGVGPRGVVDVHSAALKEASAGATPQKARALAEEGRLMVLQLMGYLASHYRNHCLGPIREAPPGVGLLEADGRGQT